MTTKKSFVAEKVQNMPFSGIRKFFDLASEMEGVVSLGVGEPDFVTPWNIREAAIYSLEQGKTMYTANAGLVELRKGISEYLHKKFNIKYGYKDQIVVTVGGSEGIDGCLRTILNPGDEVLIPEPCFVSYKPCTVLAGGVPVTIATKVENNFKLTKQELLDHITDKTKALILSYPNNPTGAVMDRADLEEIASVLREKDIVVISDEIYAELTYSKERHVSIAELDGMYEKTVVLSGFSKAFAMTGWRLGYAAGPKEIISAMNKVHQYAIMCAPTMSQYAAIEAVTNSEASVVSMKKSYDSRRRVVLEGFREMGLECFEPLGAFYLFPSIKPTGLSSEEFCQQLLFEEKVAVVPGNAFGESGEGFVRCSYAYSIENLKFALGKIKNFVDKRK